MRSPSPPPARPQEWQQLGFEPRGPVRWFDPAELFRIGAQAAMSGLFGSFADRRETQAALQGAKPDEQQQYAKELPGEDFWFDFVADIGDGFDATYSIAYLLAKEQLQFGEVVTRRGRVLVMGGDEVYPTASREQYLNRTVGPYRAAFPYIADEEQAPHLYALPGNHDWYDGLSAFLRQFAGDGRWVGAWRTRQHRSYFARKFPRGIWFWGIDIQLHADIDAPQLDYFKEAGKQLEPGDRVILATAEPSWVKDAEGEHSGYLSLMEIMEAIPTHAKVVMVLTGDSHHYAHYEESGGAGVHFVTAGGGGAFLHGTHTLRPELTLPLSQDPAHKSSTRKLTRGETFPTGDESRALIRKRTLLFPWINYLFALIWIVLWGWLMWSLCLGSAPVNLAVELAKTFSVTELDLAFNELAVLGTGLVAGLVVRLFVPAQARKAVDVALWLVFGAVLFRLCLIGAVTPLEKVWALLPRSPGAALVVVVVTVGNAFYLSRPDDFHRAGVKRKALRVGRLTLGVGSGLLHLLLWLLAATLTAQLVTHLVGWIVLTSLLAALASTLLFSCCLWFAGQYQRALLNDAFSAIAVEDYKNFLRCRIAPDGTLTVFAVGLRNVARNWELDQAKDPPGARFMAPFVRPRKETDLKPHLIEEFQVG